MISPSTFMGFNTVQQNPWFQHILGVNLGFFDGKILYLFMQHFSSVFKTKASLYVISTAKNIALKGSGKFSRLFHSLLDYLKIKRILDRNLDLSSISF